MLSAAYLGVRRKNGIGTSNHAGDGDSRRFRLAVSIDARAACLRG